MPSTAHSIQTAIAELSGASQALSRAARALELVRTTEERPSKQEPTRLPPSERVTGKQLGAVRMACRRGDISPEKLAELVAQASEHATDIVDMTRAEASALLDSLDALTGYNR